MNTPDKIEHPSLLRRLTAMLYDALLVIALLFVVNGLGLAVVVKATGGTQEILAPHAAQALSLVSTIGFFMLFWLKDGQTLGMQAWRIKLVDFDGARPSPGKCLLRCLGAILSAACLGLGYLWCLVDRNKRYWHDNISGTELILLPRNSRDKDSTPGTADDGEKPA